MTIDSSTGKIEAPQNVYLGYKEAVCIQCHNGIAGGVITNDNWKVAQTPHCALDKAKLNRDYDDEKSFLEKSYDLKFHDNKPRPLDEVSNLNLTISIDKKENIPIYNFGITYRSGEKVINDKNFTSINISELKKLYTMLR